MFIKHNLKIMFIFIFIFFTLSPFARYYNDFFPFLDENTIHIGFVLIWMSTINYRMNRSPIKRLILWVGCIIILYLALQTIKYEYVHEFGTSSRYLWYLYYFPMLFIPLICFKISLLIDKEEHTKLPFAYHILDILCLLLCLIIFTNDFNQLTFIGDLKTDQNAYTYGIVYYISVVWIACLLLATFINIYRKCRLEEVHKYIWFIFINPIICIIYFIIYTFIHTIIRVSINLPEMYAFLIIGILEGCIELGLIPTNQGYHSFFERSHLNIHMIDKDSTIPTNDYDIDHILHHHPIYGGEVIWIEDRTTINSLKKKLTQANAQLLEEKYLRDTENKLKEEKAIVDEQNRIYENINNKVVKQTTMIQTIVEEAKNKDALYKDNMAYASFLTVYIKRIANIMLKSNKEKELCISDLIVSIRESLYYLRNCRIAGWIDHDTEDTIDSTILIQMYDDFESIVEHYYPVLVGIIINVYKENDVFIIKYTLETKDNMDTIDLPISSIEIEDEITIIKMNYSKGGEEYDHI